MPKEIIYSSVNHPDDEPLVVVTWLRESQNFQVAVLKDKNKLESHDPENGFFATIETPEQADKLIKALRRAKRARFGTKAK